MKLTKMSLVAALLVGSSAFAIDNVKVSGDAKLYYSTADNSYSTPGTKTNNSLFSAKGGAGQAALGLGISADLAKNVSAGTHVTVLTTLGLQGQLVNNVWEGTAGLNDSWIVDEAWIAGTVGKTTGKIGRMQLDTPLVFTETWSIAKNTFEAAVLINQDIPDTTIVAAYVGGSNGASNINGNGTGVPAVGIANRIQSQNTSNTSNTTFSQFYNGAFAVAAINNSFKPLTLQAWYYDAPQYVDALWLEADLNCKKIPGLLAGAQYTKINYNKSAELAIAQDSDNDAYAVMLGYEMKDVATVKVSYSQVGKETKSTLGLGAAQNLATLRNHAQTKLYTEAWWNYGYVTRADTSAIHVSVEGNAADIVDLGLYYTQTNSDKNGGTADRADMQEVTLTASKSFGPLDASLAYIYTKADDQNDNSADGVQNGEAYNTIQAYLTLNF